MRVKVRPEVCGGAELRHDAEHLEAFLGGAESQALLAADGVALGRRDLLGLCLALLLVCARQKK